MAVSFHQRNLGIEKNILQKFFFVSQRSQAIILTDAKRYDYFLFSYLFSRVKIVKRTPFKKWSAFSASDCVF